MDPVEENDQHDPHYPWSLIGVTAPCSLQSTDEAASIPSNDPKLSSWSGLATNPNLKAFSASVMSAKKFTPTVEVVKFSWV